MARSHPIDSEIVEYLIERVDDGNSYVSSKHVERAIGDNRRVYIGQQLAALEDQGLLEKWSDSSTRNIYRIDFDAIKVGDLGE